MRAFIYGRVVEIPHVTLPLTIVEGERPPVAQISVGMADGPGSLHPLDGAVALHIGERMIGQPVHLTVVAEASDGPLGPRAIEHYIVDHAVPTALTVAGDLVLHAAAVRSPAGVGILLSGPSGAGKSTTTAHMAQMGWSVLGDDGVRLEATDSDVQMWSSYAGIRLHADVLDDGILDLVVGDLVAEYGTKRRVQPPQGHDAHRSHTASWFVEMGDDAPLHAQALGSAVVCSRMAEQMFFPAASPADAFRRLDKVAPLAERLNGIRLSFPRTPAGVRQAIAHLATLPKI